MRGVVLVVLGACSYAPVQASLQPDAPDARSDPDASAPTCLSRWFDGTLAFSAATILTTVNTPSNDRDPSISADEHTLYVSSDRPGGLGGYDIYMSTRTDLTDSFGAPTPFAAANSISSEGKMSITPDGLLFDVASDRAGGDGGADVWLASRTSVGVAFDPMSEALAANVNDATSQYDPALSDDGLHLYFAPGNPQYIALAVRASRTAAFSAPLAFPELTSGAGDADPSLSPDERIITFSSRRTDQNAGGSDMWYATRASSSVSFGAPVHVPDLNTTADEGDPVLSRDGCRLYFASDAAGAYDVYVAAMTP